MNQELCAFWSYDQYPYCLWGKIEEFKGDKVYINSYQGWFKPFKIMEGDAARILIDRLQYLYAEKLSDITLINEQYNDDLKKILPEAFNKH